MSGTYEIYDCEHCHSLIGGWDYYETPLRCNVCGNKTEWGSKGT